VPESLFRPMKPRSAPSQFTPWWVDLTESAGRRKRVPHARAACSAEKQGAGAQPPRLAGLESNKRVALHTSALAGSANAERLARLRPPETFRRVPKPSVASGQGWCAEAKQHGTRSRACWSVPQHKRAGIGGLPAAGPPHKRNCW